MSIKYPLSAVDDEMINLSSLVKRLSRANPHAPLAFLVDNKGTLHCPDGMQTAAVRPAVAQVVKLREVASRLMTELGCGAMQSVLLDGDSGNLALAGVDGERMAVIVGGSAAPPGALRADALWLAQSLRTLG
jgi:predicted regulator of Ras-like GTPase activity (Roadblock/LC7/MglB family)